MQFSSQISYCSIQPGVPIAEAFAHIQLHLVDDFDELFHGGFQPREAGLGFLSFGGGVGFVKLRNRGIAVHGGLPRMMICLFSGWTGLAVCAGAGCGRLWFGA
ncbi:hypothetical protein ACZ75_26505 [Massilia sp. NR 4-1]|nr:hypothetical protein ACZ75_26505 [Massilia sp. NR 4-1]